MGVIILSLWLYLSTGEDSVKLEILSIIGWVSIWEAASIFILGMHEMRELKRNFKLLRKADIAFETVEE